jgi:hypothetical protein
MWRSLNPRQLMARLTARDDAAHGRAAKLFRSYNRKQAHEARNAAILSVLRTLATICLMYGAVFSVLIMFAVAFQK